MKKTTSSTPATIAWPVLTTRITLDDVGYPDWYVTMRTNPSTRVFNQLVAADGDGAWWKALGTIVLEWNLRDETGEPLPLPKDVAGENDLELPIGLLGFTLRRYFGEVADGPRPRTADA